MKKGILIIAAILAVIAGCKKEALKNADKVNHRKNLKSLTTSSCCEGISTDCSGTILVFDDTAHFREVYECLESEYETGMMILKHCMEAYQRKTIMLLQIV